MSDANELQAQETGDKGALEAVQPLPLKVVPAVPGRDNTALVLGSTLSMNKGLRAVLQNNELQPEQQREQVAKYRELMSQMTGMDVETGLQTVIQQLTVLNNTMDGIALFEMLDEADLLDYKNPMVIFGLMLFASKESVNHQIRNVVLKQVLENLSAHDIAEMFNKLEEMAGLSDKDKSTLIKSFARVLTNSALKNTGADFDREEIKFKRKDLFSRNYEDVLGSSDTDDPLVKVLTALSLYDTELESDVLEDVYVAVIKYWKTLEKINNGEKKERREEVVPHIRVSNEFNKLLTKLLPAGLKRIKSGTELALTAITKETQKEQAALTAGTSAETVAQSTAEEVKNVVNEDELKI